MKWLVNPVACHFLLTPCGGNTDGVNAPLKYSYFRTSIVFKGGHKYKDIRLILVDRNYLLQWAANGASLNMFLFSVWKTKTETAAV